MEKRNMGAHGRNVINRRIMSNNLLVPTGTTSTRLAQVGVTAVENGFVVNKVMVVQEASRPPMQVQTTLVFKTAKEVLDELTGDLL